MDPGLDFETYGESELVERDGIWYAMHDDGIYMEVANSMIGRIAEVFRLSGEWIRPVEFALRSAPLIDGRPALRYSSCVFRYLQGDGDRWYSTDFQSIAAIDPPLHIDPCLRGEEREAGVFFVEPVSGIYQEASGFDGGSCPRCGNVRGIEGPCELSCGDRTAGAVFSCPSCGTVWRNRYTLDAVSLEIVGGD